MIIRSGGLSQPNNDDPTLWAAYWVSVGQPWRREPEIGLMRQRFLTQRQHAKADPNRVLHPFSGTRLHRADVEWLMAALYHAPSGKAAGENLSLDLRGADLRGADLSGLRDAFPNAESSKSGQRVNEQAEPMLTADANSAYGRDLTRATPLEVSDGTSEFQNPPAADESRISPSEGADNVNAEAEVVRQESRAPVSHPDSSNTARFLEAYASGERIFYRWDLAYADLREADLGKVGLAMACLNHADFSGANLEGADFGGASMRSINLSGARLVGANLYSADLTHANLHAADLQHATLKWAKLCQANLKGAILCSANLMGANLVGASIEDADLQDAQVEGITWVEQVTAPAQERPAGLYTSSAVINPHDNIDDIWAHDDR